MFDIKGLDQITNHLNELQSFASELDGEIGKVNFDTENPETVEKAIADMEAMIDEKAKNYQHNPSIMELVENMKQNYKQQILDKVSEAHNIPNS